MPNFTFGFFQPPKKPMMSPADRLNGLREELRVALGPLLRLEASLREVPTGHVAQEGQVLLEGHMNGRSRVMTSSV